MRRTSIVVALSAGVLTAFCFWGEVAPMADDKAGQETGNVAGVPPTQDINDEGYGNADAEYYNSEDDRVNDEEVSANEATGNSDEDVSGPQENAYSKPGNREN